MGSPFCMLLILGKNIVVEKEKNTVGRFKISGYREFINLLANDVTVHCIKY